MPDPIEAPFRLRRAEAVLQQRTSRLVLVIERPWNDDNVQAILRTAESFGVQHVWTVRPVEARQQKRFREQPGRSVAKGSQLWLTQRHFTTPDECLAALRAERLPIWATELGPQATEVRTPADLAPLPPRFALVMGREVDGVSPTLLAAAERRLYLPMRGFTESFNLSVATALVLQRCFDADSSLAGAMDDAERAALREAWFQRLAGDNPAREREFAAWAAAPPAAAIDARPSLESRKPRVPRKLRRKVWPERFPAPARDPGVGP
jgi:tRNA(Leu) C34 or U34 (ribose-2'-O)-methylase TrmL